MYGWWVLGLNMVEQGISQMLGGVKLERKVIALMAKMHDKQNKGKTKTDTDQMMLRRFNK